MAHFAATVFALCALAPSAVLAQHASVKVVLADAFRTPAPPNDAYAMKVDHVIISTAVMASIALGFLIIAHFDGKKFKDTIPKAIIMGSAFCVVPESIDNYLAGCFWTQSHNPNMLMFFLMGREFDYYVAVMWWAFGAILGYILYAVLIREVTNKTLWLCLGAAGLADIIVEEALLNYGGIYMYFGHQPLVLITKFPWWWLFSNVSAIFLSIAIAYRYRASLQGWRSIAICGLMPFCYISAFTLSAMPTIFVIQGDFSPLVTQLAGVATCAVALVQTCVMFNLILERNPFDLAESPKPVQLTVNGNGYAKANGNGHLNGNGHMNGNGKAKKSSKF
jgi:hypothetical protein